MKKTTKSVQQINNLISYNWYYLFQKAKRVQRYQTQFQKSFFVLKKGKLIIIQHDRKIEEEQGVYNTIRKKYDAHLRYKIQHKKYNTKKVQHKKYNTKMQHKIQHKNAAQKI